MSYLIEDQQTIIDFSEANISAMYAKGYVFTRLGKGVMTQTRSLRIDLSKFELNSENRRILKKNEGLVVEFLSLPLENYTWEIHNLGKTFYSEKFGDMTMSASKIKEMFTDLEKSNMNNVFSFRVQGESASASASGIVGYCLCYSNSEMLHYAYPFYDLNVPKEQNLGMGMMINALNFAKDSNKKYVYLGSVTDERSLYKLQFEGLEWFDTSTELSETNGTRWNQDIQKLKDLVRAN